MRQPTTDRICLSLLRNKNKMDTARLMRARRMANRIRAEKACGPCKAKKTKCNDFRPCTRCLQTDQDACHRVPSVSLNLDHIDDKSTGSMAAHSSSQSNVFDAIAKNDASIQYLIQNDADTNISVIHGKLDTITSAERSHAMKCIFATPGKQTEPLDSLACANLPSPSKHGAWSHGSALLSITAETVIENRSSLLYQALVQPVPIITQSQQQGPLDPGRHGLQAAEQGAAAAEKAWTWEAPAGPGAEDPFKADWLR